uniref:Succinylglutamate desuccinylase/Aspartoacylase catalytic domain-containing protein n=1 Tax=Candidatus Kentrum sp. DK TaxID=2126562 RepID=A0A450SUD2_9GAMM|nr:MAG: hypothetical protein BECKDK2373C_GA0170839_106026 [Candidatus Kentron sp. DK]VFJ58217.1 MAG: hypothetical protein BECKDK2373B_GA0170837_10725 [Candidatus Kentron sp. DK]
MGAAFEIGGQKVPAGQKITLNLSIGSFNNHMPANMPVRVIHGRKPGPVLFVSAAVHGDEIIGVEIIRRLLRASAIRRLKGTLLCVPVVNTFGFINHQRYLPDRRDLNRSFPGAQNGSLAGQLAYLFRQEIVARSDFGIDLHSAARHRVNLPQIRFFPSKPELGEMALAFGAPVIMEAPLRAGSLRQTATDQGVGVLLYEAGEALRFDEFAVRVGVKGILNVLKHLEMIGGRQINPPRVAPVLASGSRWVRSPVGGMFRARKSIGERAIKDEILGYVSDPFGDSHEEVPSANSGIIIGRSNLPIVNPGDPLFHLAFVGKAKSASQNIETMEQDMESDPLFDEDEII